ncbi:MAG: Ig-like domain-containing protein [Lachnospiraceae bacterium]|nr:Ig-like domain-containing protein [Lachnospiraceae bacterium]
MKKWKERGKQFATLLLAVALIGNSMDLSVLTVNAFEVLRTVVVGGVKLYTADSRSAEYATTDSEGNVTKVTDDTIPEDHYVKWEKEAGGALKLTLHNATIRYMDDAISSYGQGLVIHGDEGTTNIISTSVTADRALETDISKGQADGDDCGIYVQGNLTLTGDIDTIESSSTQGTAEGIFAEVGGVTIAGNIGSIKGTSTVDGEAYGIRTTGTECYVVTIQSGARVGNITAAAKDTATAKAIHTYGNFELQEEAVVGAITAKGSPDSSIGIHSGGSFSIQSPLTCQGSCRALYVGVKGLSLSEDLKIASPEGGTAEFITNLQGYKAWIIKDTRGKEASKVELRYNMEKAVIGLDQTTLVYSGEEQGPKITGVTFGNKTLTEGTDYTVTAGSTAKEPDSYTLTITGIGDYSGTATADWAIKKKPAKEDFTFTPPENLTYDGTAKSATVTANDSGMGVITVRYYDQAGSLLASAPTEAGDYTVKIDVAEGTDYASGTDIEVGSFTIERATPVPTVSPASPVYNGNAQNLIAEGNTTGGTLQYSLDNENWSGSIPTGTDAGSYTVYYKVVGNHNYTDVDVQSVDVTIDKATPDVTAPTAIVGLTYTGSAQTLITAGSAIGGTMLYSPDNENWSTNIPTGTAADTYTVYYRIVGNRNYKDVAAASVTVNISKADYGNPTANGGAKFGRTGTVDLSRLLADGYELGTITTTDTDSVLAGTPSVKGKKLSFTFVDDTAKVGSTAVITIPVTSSTNYRPYNIAVTVTVLSKEAQSLTFADYSVTKTYGDEIFANELIHTAGDGQVTYTSSNPAIAQVDSATGKVTILKASDTGVTITAHAAETDTYAEASASYTLTVNKALLTVTALDQKAILGGTAPDLSAPVLGTHYKVTGLVGTDVLTKAPMLTCTPDMNVEAEYVITISGAEQDSGNYEIIYVNGRLTVAQKQVSDPGTSSGGGYSGGGGGTALPDTKPDTKPDTGKAETITKTETDTNSKGKEAVTTTTTKTDADGNVISVTEKTVIPESSASTSTTVTVRKDGKGEVASAKAAITKTVTTGSKATIQSFILAQIIEAAGTSDVTVTMTVKDADGKTKYSVEADAKDFESGNKLYIYKYDTKTKEYIMMDGKTYTVSKAGNVSVSQKVKATYYLLDAEEAAEINKKILSTTKPKKATVTVKPGKRVTFTLSGKANPDNIRSITYMTSKKSVATVSKKGKVYAKKKGTAIIKAKVTLKNGMTKTIKMKVKVK